MNTKPDSLPKIPEVGEYVRGLGTLISIEDPRPTPPPPKDYVFEKVSAYGELRLNDKPLTTFNSYWDFRDLESSVDACITAMQDKCSSESITVTSDVEVVVVRVTSRYRYHLALEPNFYNENYRSFARIATGGRWNLPDDTKTVVWSSKRGDLRTSGTAV